MVDIDNIWSNIISKLNSINPLYLFIRGDNIHNLPQPPYGTVNFISYVKESYTRKGNTQTKATIDGIEKTKIEQPKLTFSINCISNKQEEALNMLRKVHTYLNNKGEQSLEEDDIILLDVTGGQNRTTVLEKDYIYKWGIDITVRVLEENVTLVDFAKRIDIQEENTQTVSKIEIEGGIK